MYASSSDEGAWSSRSPRSGGDVVAHSRQPPRAPCGSTHCRQLRAIHQRRNVARWTGGLFTRHGFSSRASTMNRRSISMFSSTSIVLHTRLHRDVGRHLNRHELNVFDQLRSCGTQGHPVDVEPVVVQQGCIALGEPLFQLKLSRGRKRPPDQPCREDETQRGEQAISRTTTALTPFVEEDRSTTLLRRLVPMLQGSSMRECRNRR